MVNNLLTAAVLLKVFDLNAEQVAIINTTITSIVTLGFLLMPAGGTPSAGQGASKLGE